MAPTTTILLALLLPLVQCVPLSQSPPQGATLVNNQLTAFSIEARDFAQFAGTRAQPNQFSINLLQNLAKRTGSMPICRIGGSTQDDLVFVASQTEPIIIIGATEGTARAPITIGPSYFESFGTFPDTQYIAGINLAVNGTNGTETRQAETEYICKALGNNLLEFEVGNEPDLFIYWNRRLSAWNVSDYVAEWQTAAAVVQKQLADSCPLLSLKQIGNKFFAPSFAGTDVNSSPSTLGPYQAFENGLDSKKDIGTLAGHNYMAGATTAGLQLQAVLMNHTAIANSIASHVALAKELKTYAPNAPYLMGETNSLSGGGAAGISNTFGAALWVVDYTLWQGVQGFQRVHFHQSGTSPYSAWAPTTNTTNAPYYGNMMAASAVGSASNTKMAWLDLGNGDDTISAYVVYEGSVLKRIVILNMKEYLSTATTARPGSTFNVSAPWGVKGATVERLTAPGAEVLSNVTFAGLSYDFALGQGKPVVVDEKATKEALSVGKDGMLSVEVQDSEAVVLHLY